MASTASKWKEKVRAARKSGSARIRRLKDEADKQEWIMAGACAAGGLAHGYLRGTGNEKVFGQDVGYAVGAAGLLGSQVMPRGTGRSMALGLGAGALAASLSETGEQKAKAMKAGK